LLPQKGEVKSVIGSADRTQHARSALHHTSRPHDAEHAGLQRANLGLAADRQAERDAIPTAASAAPTVAIATFRRTGPHGTRNGRPARPLGISPRTTCSRADCTWVGRLLLSGLSMDRAGASCNRGRKAVRPEVTWRVHSLPFRERRRLSSRRTGVGLQHRPTSRAALPFGEGRRAFSFSRPAT
jgi:hypothetical protein